MIISLEGVCVSDKERFTESLVKNKPENIGRIICCPTVYPIVNPQTFKGWLRTITRSAELWKGATNEETALATVFENSTFSVPCYVQALSTPFGDLGQQEYNLIKEVVESLSEQMVQPDVIVLFEPNLKRKSKQYGNKKTAIIYTHLLLVEWAKKHQANVVTIPAYNDDSEWSVWYNQTLSAIIKAIEVGK